MAVIGIDLGTTNSACSIFEEGKPSLIPNSLGEDLTPSVVGLDDNGSILVGSAAKDRLITHPSHTLAMFKRVMGTEHKIQLGKKTFTPVELSSILLRTLREDAEAHLKESVDQAVISVPAYFNDHQRYATKTAAELAGLKVLRLINEPTAAAMAYGLHEKKEGTFIILDMGGGTFDVSILEYFDGVMEVHASCGDNFLGGEDFVDAMVSAFLSEKNLSKEALTEKEAQTIYMLMETAKRRLSENSSYSITFEHKTESYEQELSYEWLTKVCSSLLFRVRRPIEQALSDAKMPASEMDEIILVGGGTKLALFRSTVAKLFRRFPSYTMDPDTVVALGAGVQAGLAVRDEALDDVVLTDVCPYTLGTEVVGEDKQPGYFMPIIERNSIVPISIASTVYNVAKNQTTMQINVYQGESPRVSKNIFLGSIDVKIPKGKENEIGVEIRYSYDINGLLEVDARVLATNKTYKKVIQNSPGAMSKQEIEKSEKRLAALKFHPRELQVNKSILARATRMYETSLGDKRNTIGRIIGQFESILEKQNPTEIAKAQIQVNEALDKLDSEDWF